MNKPTGYDEAKTGGEYTPVELGGHYAVIKQVSEKTSSTGKPMIVVLFDFCHPDRQANYFMDSFTADVREDKKWPFAGSKYIMVNDYQDPKKTSRNFKSFCTCVEKSNAMTVAWGGSNWGAQFKGKKIGVVFGEEENAYDGQTFMRRVPKWFCNIDAVSGAKIPAPKYLNGSAPVPKNDKPQAATDNSFMNIPEGVNEEIPF